MTDTDQTSSASGACAAGGVDGLIPASKYAKITPHSSKCCRSGEEGDLRDLSPKVG